MDFNWDLNKTLIIWGFTDLGKAVYDEARARGIDNLYFSDSASKKTVVIMINMNVWKLLIFPVIKRRIM